MTSNDEIEELIKEQVSNAYCAGVHSRADLIIGIDTSLRNRIKQLITSREKRVAEEIFKDLDELDEYFYGYEDIKSKYLTEEPGKEGEK